MEALAKINLIIFVLIAVKSIMGFRFPWETCSCCGKKIREHNSNHSAKKA